MAQRRLYTEDSVRALAPGAELVLGKEALATPAALDLAHARGIRVRWADGSTTPAAKPAGGAGAANPELAGLAASDGDYLVQVRGGRVRIHRLTDDGPVPFPPRKS